MTRIAVLRPEPGNAATCALVAAAGGTALPLPLFEIAPLAWEPPDPAAFDGLLLTSANAVRQAGPALAGLSALPVLAVGAATAHAARAAGLTVAAAGPGGAKDLAEAAGGWRRLLHLAGRERTETTLPQVATTVAVYASVPRRITATDLAALADTVALVHSPRAARRLVALPVDRSAIRLAAISAAALAAAGPGWADAAALAAPDDAAIVALAMRLAD